MSPSIKWYLSFRFFTTVAMQMKMTILGYFLYQISGEALALGMLGLCEAFPRIFLALPAGFYVERQEKRKALLIVVGSYFLLSIAMFLAMKFLTNDISTLKYIIYFCVFLMGLIGSMGMGATVAILSSIIPQDQMAKYSAISSNSWQLGAIVGPIIGGLLIKDLGSIYAYFFVILFLLVSIYAALQLPKLESQNIRKFNFENSIFEMKEGLDFVLKNKIMLWAISLDLFAVLFGGCVALLPIFATKILNVDSQGYGLLRAAMPVGAALVMLILARRPILKNTGKWLIIFIGLYGLATIFFAISTFFWFSLILLFLMGAFDAVSVVIRGALLMIETPDHMRARVSSVNSMFISSSNEIGAFESGFAAQYMGTVRSVLFGGSMTLLFVSIAWFKAKELAKFEFKK
jgi:MFS family permease